MTSFLESVSVPFPPSIVSLHRVSPISLRLGSSSAVSVEVLGHPLPRVSWFIGKNRLQSKDPNVRAEVDGEGRRHTLRVTKVTQELVDEGIAVEAKNDAGRDFKRIAVTTCQDEQVEDVSRRTASTLASSNGALGCMSGFGGGLSVSGRSSYSFTDDVFDELISPGIPPLLLVQPKEVLFPDSAFREIVCPTESSSSPDLIPIKAREKNLGTKVTDSRPSGGSNKPVHSASQHPGVRSDAQEIWTLEGVALDSVCRNLLRDAVPSADDMDELVSQNEEWKPNRRTNSKVSAKSETGKRGHNDGNTLQPLTAPGTVAAQDINTKKTSRLAKLKNKLKKIKMSSSGKKQMDDNREDSPSVHPIATNEVLEIQIISKKDETSKSDESSDGKAVSTKKKPGKKTFTSAQNDQMVEVIVPYSTEANNSGKFPTVISRSSTDKRVSHHHENDNGYMAKNLLVDCQNQSAASGDLSLPGYIVEEAKKPQAWQSRQIEFQTHSFPRLELILKEPNACESDINEIFDESRISLTCSSPPADEVERCKLRLSSSLIQEQSSFSRFQQRRNDSPNTRINSVLHSSSGRAGYSNGNELYTNTCGGLASPTSSGEQLENRVTRNDDGELKTGADEPSETQNHGSVVERRTRAEPTSRSRSCQRASTRNRRSWIESARSVEIQVPRRSRSASRTRWRSLNKEWDLLTVTTRTEETRTLPKATAAAPVSLSVRNTNEATVADDKATTTTTTTTKPTTTTKIKHETRQTSTEQRKKSPNISVKQISRDPTRQTTTSHQEKAVHRAKQTPPERSNSSNPTNSIDTGKSIFKRSQTIDQKETVKTPESQVKIRTQQRSRKAKAQSLESNDSIYSDEDLDEKLSISYHREAPKSFCSDVIQMFALENIQRAEQCRVAIENETEAKAQISTVKRKNTGSAKVQETDSGKMEELSEAKQKSEVITELRNSTEIVDFKANVNEVKPETVELRFKVIEVNPTMKVVEPNHKVAEVGYDVEKIELNNETDKVNRKPHLVEVTHDVNYNKETAELSHELSKVHREVNYNREKVELNQGLPEVNHEKKAIEFNDGVTELNDALNKLRAEMTELNTGKAQTSSTSVYPSGYTTVENPEEPSDRYYCSLLVTGQHHSLGSLQEKQDCLGRSQVKEVSLDPEVPGRNAGGLELNPETTQLNDRAVQLSDALTKLSAEMVEFNSDIPECNVNSPRSNLATCEVNIALPKSSSSLAASKENEVSDGKFSSSVILTKQHSFSTPQENILQESYTAFNKIHISANREQPNTVSEHRKDPNREGKTKNTSGNGTSDSECLQSASGDNTVPTNVSVLYTGKESIQTGNFETTMDSEDVLNRLSTVRLQTDKSLSTVETYVTYVIESVMPEVMSEVTNGVKDTDDANKTDSEVTRGPHSEDAMTTFNSITPEVMSDVTKDICDTLDADTMESLTPDVMSEVSEVFIDAVCRATARNVCMEDTQIGRIAVTDSSTETIQQSLKSSDVLVFIKMTTDDSTRMDGGPGSRFPPEELSSEETDGDSYAIVDDNWKNSYDTCYTAIDVQPADEADTCEEDETSIAVENTLEYKQVEADTLKETRIKTLDKDNKQDNREAFLDDIPSAHVYASTVVDTKDVLQEAVMPHIISNTETSLIEYDSTINSVWLTDNRAKDEKTGRHHELPEAFDDQVNVYDYSTYIKSVFGAKAVASCADEINEDTRNSEAVGSSSDSSNLSEPTIVRHTNKHFSDALDTNAATDAHDLMDVELSETIDKRTTDETIDELKLTAEMYCVPAKVHATLNFENESPSFKIPEDVRISQAERKISVSSVVLRRPDVRYVTVEEKAIGLAPNWPTTKDAAHSIDAGAVSKAQRNKFQTEIIAEQQSMNITLPSSIISQSEDDRATRSTTRVTSLAEFMINSSRVENDKVSDVEHNRTDRRPNRTSLSHITLQTEKNDALKGPHFVRPKRTSLSEIKLQTEKNYALEGPYLVRPNQTSLLEIQLPAEKSCALEDSHRVRPNRTSLSEIKLQIEKNYALESSHLVRPNRTSLPEINLQTEKNYALESSHLVGQTNAKPNTNRTFRTILTIVGHSSKDEMSINKQEDIAVRKNNKTVDEVNDSSNQVATLAFPACITVSPNDKDQLDLLVSPNVTHETAAGVSEKKLPNTHFSLIGDTPRTEKDSRQVDLNSSNVDEVDNTDDINYNEIVDGSSVEATKETIEELDTQASENIADSRSHVNIKDGYDSTSLDLNQKNLYTEPSSKILEDSEVSEDNLTLSSAMNADDNRLEEEERQRYELHHDNKIQKQNEILCELMCSNQVMVVTNVETEGELESGSEDKVIWKEEEEAIEMPKDGEEEKEKYINPSVVHYDDESKDHHESLGELVTEDGSHFDQALVDTSVEIEGEPQSENTEKTSWKEDEVVDMQQGEEEERNSYTDVTEVHDDNGIFSELIAVDWSLLDRGMIVGTAETGVKPESGIAEKISWKEEEAVDTVKNEEEEEKQRYIGVIKVHRDNKSKEHDENLDGLISESESHFDQASVTISVENEGEPESENAEEMSWKEDEAEDMQQDEKEERKSYIDVTEVHYDNKSRDDEDGSRFDQAIVATSAETEGEPESGNAESGNAEKITWKEEEEEAVDTINEEEEEDRQRHINVTEVHHDNEINEHDESLDEMIPEGKSHFDQASVITNVETECVIESEIVDKISWKEEGNLLDRDMVVNIAETEGEPETRNAEKIAWKEEDVVDVPNDVEGEKTGYVDITETYYSEESKEHDKILGEFLPEGQGHFAVIESEKADTISWKEEEAVDMQEDAEERRKIHIDVSEAYYGKEIIDELLPEVGSHFDQAVVITRVETEGESERKSAYNTSWKEEEAVDMVKSEDEEKKRYIDVTEVHYDNEIKEQNEVLGQTIHEDLSYFNQATLVTSVENEGESESNNANKTSWKEEEAVDMVRDEDKERQRYIDVIEVHYDDESNEHDESLGEMLPEGVSHIDQVTVITSAENEGEREDENAEKMSWKEDEVLNVHIDEENSGQEFLNPESVAADLNDASVPIEEFGENGQAQGDTDIDFEITNKLESSDGYGLEMERLSETEHLQTLITLQEKSNYEKNSHKYRTSPDIEINTDLESRTEDLSEEIWQLVEDHSTVKKNLPGTGTESDDYLESISHSISEKRWQTIELLHKNSNETEAETPKLVTRGNKDYEYETSSESLSERKLQTISPPDNLRYQEISDEATSERKCQTINPSETSRSPETASQDDYESFSTSLREIGWRTVTVNERSNDNTRSEIDPVHTDNKDRPENPSDSDYMVTYEYGEMYSVFYRIPFSIETLRESVLDDFNNSPSIRRLLIRYPSLRPGTWKWSTSRDRNSAQETRVKEVQHLESVSLADHFTPEFMTEKFDTFSNFSFDESN